MKKLIYSTVIYLLFLINTNANDKQVLFLTSAGSSFGLARQESHRAANRHGMKVLSTRTSKQGNIWVSISKVTPKY